MLREPSKAQIVMYTTDWCSDCWRAKQVMKAMKVDYQEIDITQNEEALSTVMRLNDGNQSVPTLLFPDGSVLTEPNITALVQKLQQFI